MRMSIQHLTCPTLALDLAGTSEYLRVDFPNDDTSLISMTVALAHELEQPTEPALLKHYTSDSNILKVLNLLFLDDLRAQLQEAGDTPRKLLNMRNRMAKIRVFNPIHLRRRSQKGRFLHQPVFDQLLAD